MKEIPKDNKYLLYVLQDLLVSSHSIQGSGNSHIQLSPNIITVIKYESHTYDMTSLHLHIQVCVHVKNLSIIIEGKGLPS